MEDGTETTRVADVTISLVNAMGATMAAEQSKPDTGLFDFSQAPLASYTIAATPADPNLVVTTPNPQPIQVAQGQEIVTGIKIGVVVQSLETRDSDNDGVLDRAEDLNSDSNLENDDTDGDGLPNYRDADDDGDAILTSIERTLGDTDGDQVLNYLDSDDDNDGVPTALEGSGDSNGNSIPDYLERDVIGNGGNVQRLFLPVVFR